MSGMVNSLEILAVDVQIQSVDSCFEFQNHGHRVACPSMSSELAVDVYVGTGDPVSITRAAVDV